MTATQLIWENAKNGNQTTNQLWIHRSECDRVYYNSNRWIRGSETVRSLWAFRYSIIVHENMSGSWNISSSPRPAQPCGKLSWTSSMDPRRSSPQCAARSFRQQAVFENTTRMKSEGFQGSTGFNGFKASTVDFRVCFRARMHDSGVSHPVRTAGYMATFATAPSVHVHLEAWVFQRKKNKFVIKQSWLLFLFLKNELDFLKQIRQTRHWWMQENAVWS